MPEPVTLEDDEIIVTRADLGALVDEVRASRIELGELAQSHAQLVTTLESFATRAEPLLARVEKRAHVAGALFRSSKG